MSKKVYLLLSILFFSSSVFLFYLLSEEKKIKKEFTNQVSSSTPALTSIESVEEFDDVKTFVFDNFHGITDISDKFKFLYPKNWINEGQYFSPQMIEYYNIYNVEAPIYFDLVRVDIFSQTELKYKIDKSKRYKPDSTMTFDGKQFKKYDIVDYGSYGGESAGRVIVYVGPRIAIGGNDYYLVFHWEEKPLTTSIIGNDPRVFEQMLESIDFI